MKVELAAYRIRSHKISLFCHDCDCAEASLRAWCRLCAGNALSNLHAHIRSQRLLAAATARSSKENIHYGRWYEEKKSVELRVHLFYFIYLFNFYLIIFLLIFFFCFFLTFFEAGFVGFHSIQSFHKRGDYVIGYDNFNSV